MRPNDLMPFPDAQANPRLDFWLWLLLVAIALAKPFATIVEAAQVTVRSQPPWRSKFFHLATRRGRKIAKLAMARKLAVHLYWMWRQGWDYGQFEKLGSHAREPGNLHGAQ
jgi:hypothetical protein